MDTNTNTAKIDLSTLAKMIAANMVESVPLEKQVWGPEKCASYLETSVSNFSQNIAPHPKFPKPVLVPTARGSRMHPRYRAVDVIEYVLKCKAE